MFSSPEPPDRVERHHRGRTVPEGAPVIRVKERNQQMRLASVERLRTPERFSKHLILVAVAFVRKAKE